MAEVSEIRVTITADALLSSLWYSDGSGAAGHAGLGIETQMPDDYVLSEIRPIRDAEPPQVLLVLRRKDAHEYA